MGYSKKGIFLIRSAYHLALQLQQAAKEKASIEKLVEGFWQKIGQLKTPEKVKNFIWRALKNILSIDVIFFIEK